MATQTKAYRDESSAGPPRLRKAEEVHTRGRPEEISLVQPEGKDGKEMSLQSCSNRAKEKGETVCFQGCTGKGQEAAGADCKHGWIERKKNKWEWCEDQRGGLWGIPSFSGQDPGQPDIIMKLALL